MKMVGDMKWTFNKTNIRSSHLQDRHSLVKIYLRIDVIFQPADLYSSEKSFCKDSRSTMVLLASFVFL